MFICTLNNKSRRRLSPLAGYLSQVLLLAVVFLATACFGNPVAAMEFVTREAFNVEKNGYKDYPYHVLFQKFHTSQGVEKRKIRNVIIVKQVFDPEIRQRAIEAGAEFESFYGVIKSVDSESLRLWLPESDSFKDFSVSIDRIPLENKQEYNVSAANIAGFAALVRALDNRVYLIDIRFALTAPEKLKVKRRGKKNVVSWQQPPTIQKTSGYRVFVNGKPYKMVTATSVEVPRSREQADEFYVKAVYPHHKGLIESGASPTLYDAASAEEIQLRQQAGNLYNQIVVFLDRSDSHAARKLLAENQELLGAYLNPENKSLIQTVTGFYQAIDEGERLTERRPETLESLVVAEAAFQRAATEASRLPAKFGLTRVARDKISQNTDLTTRLNDKLQKQSAHQILAQVSANLNPARWEQAKKLIYQKQTYLEQHLDQKDKTAVLNLVAFFQNIDDGDLSAGIQPLTRQHLDKAFNSYQQAEKKGHTLPANLDAGFIARLKIKAIVNQRESLAAEQQKQLAHKTWEELTVALNPSEWQTAKTLLHDNRPRLIKHLAAENKNALSTLVDFFASLDEGDRFAGRKPATMQNLDRAAMFYQRADQKAKTLPKSLDVGFITLVKSDEIAQLKSRLQHKLYTQESKKTYAQIAAALNAEQWRDASRLLREKQEFLMRYLDKQHQADCLTLAGFFRDIDRGDLLADTPPLTLQTLDEALEVYRQAVKKAQTLPPNLDPGLLTQQKMRSIAERKELLAKGQEEALALKAYNQVVTDLTPGGWQQAKEQLLRNQEVFLKNLDDKRKSAVIGLLAFFRTLDEGDRLVSVHPATTPNLDKAGALYRQAGQKSAGLRGIPNLAFITELKTGEVKNRKLRLLTKLQQVEAEKTFTQITTALDTGRWQDARNLVYTKQDLLSKHLDPARQAGCLTLAGFFRDMDKGDLLADAQPLTLQTLDEALEVYRQAVKKAQTLPPNLDPGLLTQQKMRSIAERKELLAKGQQEALALNAYNQVVTDLTPGRWQQAKAQLLHNQEAFLKNLEDKRKSAVIGLLAFFRTLDEGDRLVSVRPATAPNLDKAGALYRQAGQNAAGLRGIPNLAFITELKTGEVKNRKLRLLTKLQQVEAEKTFTQITTALDTGRWQDARNLVYTKQDLLSKHLDPARQAGCLTLAGFFRDMDKGDRLAASQPPSTHNLDSALEVYRQAMEKSQSLPPDLGAGLIAKQKIQEIITRKNQLAGDRQKTLARKTFDRAIAALTPADWKTARTLLAEDEELLVMHLDPAKKTTLNRLVTFFQLIDEGHRLSTRQPATLDSLNMARSSYHLAEQKAQGLSEIADLTFLTRQAIKTNAELRTALEYRQKQADALQAYQQIQKTLTATDWEAGMRLSLDKLPQSIAYLEKPAQEHAQLLIAFFRDIEAGDKLGFKRPETDSNLKNAREHYRQAANKAKSLAGRLEVEFIALARLDNLDIQRAELVKRQQALLAAQQPQTPPPPPMPQPPPPAPAAPVKIVRQAAFDETVDAKTARKLGMKNFSGQNYDLSFKYFARVYGKQIRKLQKSGKKQSFTILSIPPQARAEIIFLVQLDRLKKSSGGDEDLLQDGLAEMLDEIENASGTWSIIKERKRNKIRKHIDRYPF